MKPAYEELEEKVQAYSHDLRKYRSIVQVDKIMRATTDLELLLKRVLDFMLEDFDSDRAFLLYPCDPSSPTYRVAYECTKPEYPGSATLADNELPMLECARLVMSRALEAKEPVVFHLDDPEMKQDATANRFRIESQVVLAIYPKVGKPWIIGMHQCSYDREWSKDEKELLVEISYRFSDSLSNLLLLQNLRESEEQFRLFITNFPGMAFIAEPGKRIVYANQTYAKLHGRRPEDILSLEYKDYISPDKLARIEQQDRQIVQGKKLIKTEETFSFKSRTSQWMVYKFPLFKHDGSILIGGMCIDITKQKHAEEELLQIQKLESLGVVAAGIAHDFNNILCGLFGFISLALKNDDNVKKDAYLGRAMDVYSRARYLANRLLTFSKGRSLEIEVLSLDTLLKEAALLALSGSNVECDYSIDRDLTPINADANQLSQVFNNVLLNARQAMPAGGTISIQAANETIRKDQIQDLAPGDYVKVTIDDQGEGIPEEFLTKIFDPFFTTKDAGTGLGLSTSYSIVKQHNGTIEIKSIPGQGTNVVIYLPIGTGDYRYSSPQSVTHQRKGNESILIMDDDDDVLEFADQTLSGQGYQVHLARTGEEAIAAYKKAFQEDRRFDLTILDLTVKGGMGGEDAVREILQFDPNALVIVCSGYHGNAILSKPQEWGFIDVIHKPFTMETLIDTVGSVIEKQV